MVQKLYWHIISLLTLVFSFVLGLSSAYAITNTNSIDLETSSTQYLSITDASQTGLDITGNLTIEAWINVESITGTDMVIASKEDVSSNRSYSFYIDSNGKLTSVVNEAPGGTDQSISVGSTNFGNLLGTWHHVAMRYTATSGVIDFTVDGVDDSATHSYVNATAINNSSGAFRIGAMSTGGSWRFDGKIDEVRIWNTTRSVSDIANNRFAKLNGTETNLQGYWQLNATTTDKTVNANNLTINNGAAFSEDPGHQIVCTFPSASTYSDSFTLNLSCNLLGLY